MHLRVHRLGRCWAEEEIIIMHDRNLEMCTFSLALLTFFNLQVPQTHSASPFFPSSLPVHMVEPQEMAKSARVPKQEADAREWRCCPAFLCGWHSFRSPGGCKETQWVEGHAYKDPRSSHMSTQQWREQSSPPSAVGCNTNKTFESLVYYKWDIAKNSQYRMKPT